MPSYDALKIFFTIPDMIASNLSTVLQIGRHLVTYRPYADQLLTLGHMVEAFADKQPANDNEPQDQAEPQAPEPAVAQSKNAALITTMEMLRDGETPAPRWAREMAVDWLKNRSLPGTNDRGQRLVEQVTMANRLSLFMLKPRKVGRSSLKTMHSERLHAPNSVQIANRPLIEKLLSDKPMPSKRAKSSDFDYAA